ncbi:glycerophosphodiester phosphodiesterase family protein, partial [Autumnicola musiva]
MFLVALGCKNNHYRNQETQEIKLAIEGVQVKGHRGDHGNFPENSIPAFISAVKKGVDVLELDVVISKDKKVVVSHEPFMYSLYDTTPTGGSIQKANERSYNMYQMTYDSIRQYDAGSRGNRLFPEQEKIKTFKPLLSEVIDSVENFIAAEGLQPVKFNI